MDDRDRNPKGIGSHPVGTGLGAGGGAVAGAVVGGAVGGPVGAVVGGTVGAVAGGAAGRAAGEALDPKVENAYWRENYRNRPYYRAGKEYSVYEPAYRYGWESANHTDYRGRKFHEVENDLERGWEKAKGQAKETWGDIKDATRDAWNRVRGERY